MRKIIFIFLIPFITVCQNYQKDVLQAGKNFTSLKSYSMTLVYQLFLDNNFVKPYQERYMEIKKQGNNLFVKQNNGMEILDNEHYQIMVDNDEKVFAVLKKDANSSLDSSGNLIYSILRTNVDSLSKIYDKVKLVSNINGISTYELIYKPNEQLEKLTMSINNTKKFYDQVIVYYKKPVKIKSIDERMHYVTLKITYKNFNQKCVINKKTFDEANYLSISSKGRVALNKKYSGYKFIKSE